VVALKGTPHHRRSFAPLREWLAVRG
jgi:hypothetical protein